MINVIGALEPLISNGSNAPNSYEKRCNFYSRFPIPDSRFPIPDSSQL
ncbi:hypothetical protein [Moorena sp. SIO4G3]|nr:hypothetical protein [Moorena sp. SIO4G3]NEO77731.1 hypothetical protein [Moorena sp. SIO4G3]